MKVKLPKPLHGWRVFAGEVGIIVLGVLLALGAQQFVESLQWHYRVRETRKALDAELSHDFAAVQWRLNQTPCVRARLAELDHWAASFAVGKPLKLKKRIDRPIFFTLRTAVWQSTDAEVSSRMPLQTKLDYASTYEMTKTFSDLLNDEQADWTTIESYQNNTTLDRHELHEVQAAIASLKSADEILEVFKIRGAQFAEKLRLQPERDIDSGLREQARRFNEELCKPLL